MKKHAQSIDVCHDKPFEIGDTYQIQRGDKLPKYLITEIVEKRNPVKTGKNHHPDGVMFYRVKGHDIGN